MSKPHVYVQDRYSARSETRLRAPNTVWLRGLAVADLYTARDVVDAMRHLDYPDIPYHALLSRAADRAPGKKAITFGETTMTFGEVDAACNSVAAGLWRLGVRRGDRIAFFLPNCPEYEVGFFAAARIGAVPSPLNPSYKEREVRHQVQDSGASAVIVHASLLPTLTAALQGLTEVATVVVVGEGETPGSVPMSDLLASGGAPPLVPLGPDDLAALPYSSGTTGVSKGVMLTQRNLVCNALQFVEATGTTESDTLLIFLPLYHIYGVALMGTAVAGVASQVLMERFHLETMVDLVGREHVTELFVVPPVMLALAGAPNLQPEQFAGLRFIKSAAAPLAPDVARRVAARLRVPVIQAYGMTESSPLTHMVPLDEQGFDNVGVVAADTECRIVDLESSDTELPVCAVGEVVVRGPQVMAGYWNAPDDTARTLRGGWLHTGDIGRVDAQGRLSIVDRKKEMIKYKAFSIAPAELEALLLEHPDVEDCAVTPQPDPDAGEVPRAHVVLRSGATASPAELQAFVAERVAGYKQIRSLELVDAIPRTPSGKVLRRVLREQRPAQSQAPS